MGQFDKSLAFNPALVKTQDFFLLFLLTQTMEVLWVITGKNKKNPEKATKKINHIYLYLCVCVCVNAC